MIQTEQELKTIGTRLNFSLLSIDKYVASRNTEWLHLVTRLCLVWRLWNNPAVFIGLKFSDLFACSFIQ